MSERPVAEASTDRYNTRQTPMPSAVFEPAIPATKRQQTYALDRAATGIGRGLPS
jgi:hypothetical protein